VLRSPLPDSHVPSLLINIDVDDLKKGIAFYCAALDLSVGRRFGHDAVELLGANAPIYLLAKPNGTVASASSRHLRSYARHWTPIHLDFVVDSIEAAVDKARNAGARLEGSIRTNSWGRIAMLADPFGHGICLIEFLGRGYDEIAERTEGHTAKRSHKREA
jgi:predicted enzyme related to lactoylglutathione lyase